MKVLCIVQARSSSSRLPGKVLKKVLEKELILHQLERVARSRLIDKTVLATSVSSSDDYLESIVAASGFTVIRGNLEDVLERFKVASDMFPSDTIVRITGDCPLIDAEIIDEVIEAFYNSGADYISNSMDEDKLTVPDGYDVEVFSRDLLEEAHKRARLGSEREHVTPWMRKAGNCTARHYEHQKTREFFRLTVDDEIDFRLIKWIIESLGCDSRVFHLDDVIALLEKEPRIARINIGTVRNEGYLKSLNEDGKIKMSDSGL